MLPVPYDFRDDAGMTTAEYAVGTVAAVGLAGILYKLLTSSEVRNLIWAIIQKAVSTSYRRSPPGAPESPRGSGAPLCRPVWSSPLRSTDSSSPLRIGVPPVDVLDELAYVGSRAGRSPAPGREATCLAA